MKDNNELVIDFETGNMVSPKVIELKDVFKINKLKYEDDKSYEENLKMLDEFTKTNENIAKLKIKMKSIKLKYNNKMNYDENLQKYQAKKDELDEKKRIAEEERKLKERENQVKYMYPFVFHYAGKNIDVSHIFTEGENYTDEEITSKLLEHRFYEFSGSVTYKLFEEDNTLVPIFKQHKKG